MANIKFFRGLHASIQSKLAAQEFPAGSIIFVTDEPIIYMIKADLSAEKFDGNGFNIDDVRVVEKVELAADGHSIKVTYTGSESPKMVTLTQNLVSAEADGLMSKEDKAKLDSLDASARGSYQSNLDETVATVTDLGGIAAGTTVASLNGKTYDEMFDALIFPTVQPTKVDPSVSIVRKSGVTDIREVGDTAWTAADFTVTANVGAIKINNVKKQDYAGAASDVKAVGVPVDMATYGKKSVTGSATFAAGPQPLDSKGGNATSVAKYTGGTKTSSATYVYVVYPFYANNANITTFAKLPLVKSDVNNFTVVYVSEVGANKHAIKVPATRDITKIEMLNTLSGKYEEIAKSNFVKTTESINEVAYNVYTRNQGVNGDATFKFTYKNN